MKHDVFVVTGGKPRHLSVQQAEVLVGDGRAQWIGQRKIKLRAAEAVKKIGWHIAKSGRAGPVVMQME